VPVKICRLTCDVSLTRHRTESSLAVLHIWEREFAVLQIELIEQPFDREKNIKKGFCFITFETGDPVDVICVNQKHHVGGRDVSTAAAFDFASLVFLLTSVSIFPCYSVQMCAYICFFYLLDGCMGVRLFSDRSSCFCTLVNVGAYHYLIGLVYMFVYVARRCSCCVKLGERCFAFAGPAAWNSLPSYIQEQSNTDTFKRHLKTFLFEQCYSSSSP